MGQREERRKEKEKEMGEHRTPDFQTFDVEPPAQILAASCIAEIA